MPTTNPVPSSDPSDLVFNAEKIDQVVNSTAETFTDRLGTVRKTINGVMIPLQDAATEAIDTDIPALVGDVQTARNTAVNTTIPALVAQVSETVAATYVGQAGASADDAQAAQAAAELARDAALVGAGVYATEAAGRAAVADGAAFKVQGSGDVAAFEYRRTNSTTSVLIATYPSAQAVRQPAWAGKKNGWPDPFFRRHDYLSHTFAGRDRWWQGFVTSGAPVGWTKVSDATFGAYALQRTSGYNQTTFSGPSIWLDEINAVPGDTITAYVLITGPSGGAVYSAMRFMTDSEVVLGSAMSMLSAAGANNITASATPQWLRLSAVVPETGTRLYIYPYNISGNTGFNLVSCWVFKGGVTEGPEWPSLHDSYFDVRDAEFGTRISAAESSLSTATQTIAALGFDTASRKAIGVYTPLVRHESVLGDGEMAGDLNYGIKILGYHTQVALPTVMNAVQCRIWASNSATNIEWRVWVRSSNAAFNMQSTTPAASGTVLAGDFPTANNLYTLELPTPVVIGVNQYVFVMFKAADNSNMNMRNWAYNAGITPARTGFPLAVSNTWDATWGMSSPAINYGQPAIKLLMQSEELRAQNATAATIAYSNTSSGLAATTVQAAIDLLAAGSGAPEMVMPPAIFGVEGRECNVYFDNLHLADAGEYFHDVTSASASGVQQQERWTWIPAGAVTTGSLVVSAHDKRTGTALTTKTAAQRAAASSAGAGSNKKLIVIGDSLVGAGAITQTLVDVAATDSMGITLLGTLGAGSNKHEGRGGWTIAAYTSNYSDGTVGANPFWISGAVNFPQYLTSNSIATPDWVAIHLGINDIFGQTTDAGAISTATTAFNALDTLITSIKAAGAGVKVALMLPTPPASSQDAFGANYGAGQTRWRFKRNIMLWTQTLITRYAGQEASRIYIAPTNTAIDTTNNVSYAAAAPINSRSSVSVARQNNGVHPANSGYQQIGDALWAFLKYYAGV